MTKEISLRPVCFHAKMRENTRVEAQSIFRDVHAAAKNGWNTYSRPAGRELCEAFLTVWNKRSLVGAGFYPARKRRTHGRGRAHAPAGPLSRLRRQLSQRESQVGADILGGPLRGGCGLPRRPDGPPRNDMARRIAGNWWAEKHRSPCRPSQSAAPTALPEGEPSRGRRPRRPASTPAGSGGAEPTPIQWGRL